MLEWLDMLALTTQVRFCRVPSSLIFQMFSLFVHWTWWRCNLKLNLPLSPALNPEAPPKVINRGCQVICCGQGVSTYEAGTERWTGLQTTNLYSKNGSRRFASLHVYLTTCSYPFRFKLWNLNKPALEADDGVRFGYSWGPTEFLTFDKSTGTLWP